MSNETPTFDPNDIPDEKSLASEAKIDLWLVERGVNPDRIARVRKLLSGKLVESEVEEDV